MSQSHTVLFMDWNDVDTGILRPTFDPERLSERGRKEIERHAREWKLYFAQTGHGMHRLRLAHGVAITVEKARKSEPWLLAEHPWEQMLSFPTVLYDEGRYRCWYGCLVTEGQELVFDGERGMETQGPYLCYAESDDATHWTKPRLGVYTYRGSAENNIACDRANTATVFRDDAAGPEERYKFFYFDALKDVPEDASPHVRYGLYGAVSPDGYHWKHLDKPLIRYFCDTQNVGAWDPVNKEYVGYFRSHVSGRAVSRSATKDFAEWPHPVTVLYPGSEEAPTVDYYTNCYTCYPGDATMRLLFPAMFHHNDDRVDVRLAMSRNGVAFNWVSRDPVIEVGEPGDFDAGSIYASPNLIRLPDGSLALPYLGYETGHEEDWFRAFYREWGGRAGIAWAIWDDGRLAGVEAADFGEFWTRPALFEGSGIEINARTARHGKVEAEVWEEHAEEGLPGFLFSESSAFAGDEIWAPYRWKGDLTVLRGKTICLRFRLSCAKVFGYRFV